MQYLVLFFAAALTAVLITRLLLARVVVFEYERGLLYANGKFRRVLGPGAHWHVPSLSMVRKVDVRPRFLLMAGQEVLSADNVGLKITLAAGIEIAEPYAAVNEVENYEQALYLELQLALREIVGSVKIDELLETRGEVGRKLSERVGGRAQDFGLRLISVNVKDIMFPGELKKVFAQVVNARKQGEAALERARGEAAALRSLANAAKVLENNPALMQLRLMQTVEGGAGNTVVWGAPPQPLLVPHKTADEQA